MSMIKNGLLETLVPITESTRLDDTNSLLETLVPLTNSTTPDEPTGLLESLIPLAENTSTTNSLLDSLIKVIAPNSAQPGELGPTGEPLLGPTGEPLSELGPTGEPPSELGPTGEPLSELGPTGEPISELGPTGEPLSELGSNGQPISELGPTGKPPPIESNDFFNIMEQMFDDTTLDVLFIHENEPSSFEKLFIDLLGKKKLDKVSNKIKMNQIFDYFRKASRPAGGGLSLNEFKNFIKHKIAEIRPKISQ